MNRRALIWTQLREANEEVALPLDGSSATYLHLTTLAPLISRYHLIVIPTVCLVTSPPDPASSLVPTLVPNPSEVSAIFTWPLDAFIDPASATSPDDEYSFGDFILAGELGSSPYRWHSLAHPSMPSPITGLTFDVLLSLARVAYPPSTFTGEAPSQLSWPELVDLASRAGWASRKKPDGPVMTPLGLGNASR